MLKKERTAVSRNRMLLGIALFATLTAVSGLIRVPLPVVPMTLQTVFVYLAGGILGSCGGVMSQLLFLGIGLMGVPIFTVGGGPGYVLQPTFGYLAGFPLAAWIVGLIAERRKEPQKLWGWVGVYGIGFLIIHVVGVVYLWTSINFIVEKQLSWNGAMWAGVFIFVPGEAVKIFLAAALTIRVLPLLNRG
jgi:biotin transport system substrate-specific component